MAKIHLDRIKQKYGWTGGKYQALMSHILASQSTMISNRIGEIQKSKINKHISYSERKLGIKLKVPDLSEILPARSVHIRKAADRGKLLSDSLRASLTQNLRESVLEYMAEGRPLMQGVRGEKRGRMNPELVNQFEARIRNTFEAYAKRDPKLQVPPNCRAIADTEVRSSVNEIKHKYMERLAESNRDTLEIRKTWIHHPNLSKDPRPGHRVTNGKTVAMNEMFKVPIYERIGTVKTGIRSGRARWKKTGGFVWLSYPHDSQGPIGEIASCHCEADYMIVVKGNQNA
jgi:hypothetical protein